MTNIPRRAGRPRTASDDEVFEAIDGIVNALGPNGVTFARVAAAVGVTASALAQRFGTKRGLLVAYARQRSTMVAATFADARRTHPDAVVALPAALAALTVTISTRDEMANSIAFLHLDLIDAELRSLAVTQSRQIRRHIAGLLREAIAAGDLVHHDPTGLARLVYAIYSGAMVTWTMDGRGTLQRWIQSHVEAAMQPHRVG